MFVARKKTDKQFKQEVYDLVKDEYTVLGKYTGNKQKIKLKHNTCNNEYEVRPNDFLMGRRCPICFGKFKKTTIQFKQEVYDLVKDEYTVLGEYANTDTKILMKHNTCNNEYEVRPNDFLKGRRCPICSDKLRHFHRTKTDKQFKQEVYDLVKDEYTVLESYKGTNTSIKFRHNKCGLIYNVSPNKFLNAKNRCPNCNTIPTKTTIEFKKEVYKKVGNEYTVLGSYKTNKTKIKMRHNICGYEWNITPTHFLSCDNRCPKCNESKGERRIKNYLNNNGIKFKTQFSFKDCKYKIPLKFDFNIFLGNGYIVLIEYDGIQHFKECFYKNDYKLNQIRDKIKDDYCNKRNDIHLYRIKYTEFDNIKTILDNIIIKEESSIKIKNLI